MKQYRPSQEVQYRPSQDREGESVAEGNRAGGAKETEGETEGKEPKETVGVESWADTVEASRGRSLNDPSFRQKKQESLAQKWWRPWGMRHRTEAYGRDTQARWDRFEDDVEEQVARGELSPCLDSSCVLCRLTTLFLEGEVRWEENCVQSLQPPEAWIEYPGRGVRRRFDPDNTQWRIINVRGPRVVRTYKPRKLP